MKKSTTLQQLADELETSLDIYGQIKKSIKCDYCNKIQVDREDLLSIKNTGMCMSCDHIHTDKYED